MNKTMKMYTSVSKYPFSKTILKYALLFKAPYFFSIRPIVMELSPGKSSIKMKDRRSVRNHIGTVHAIAMCNLCELSMGLAIDAAMPEDLRWIASGMTVNYKKIARGTLVSYCSFDLSIIKEGRVTIPVEVKDKNGDCVMDADISVHVSKRRTE